MQDVPVEYLHWMWHNTTGGRELSLAVHKYIEKSINALKMERKDLIWTKE